MGGKLELFVRKKWKKRLPKSSQTDYRKPDFCVIFTELQDNFYHSYYKMIVYDRYNMI